MDVTTDVGPNAVTPEASRLFEQRLCEFGKDDPGTIGCLPAVRWNRSPLVVASAATSG